MRGNSAPSEGFPNEPQIKKTLPRGGKREGQPEGGSEVNLFLEFRDLRPAMDIGEEDRLPQADAGRI